MTAYYRAVYIEIYNNFASVYPRAPKLRHEDCLKEIEKDKLEFLTDLRLKFTPQEEALLEKIEAGTADLDDYNLAYEGSENYVSIIEEELGEDITPEMFRQIARCVLGKLSAHERLEMLSELGNLEEEA